MTKPTGQGARLLAVALGLAILGAAFTRAAQAENYPSQSIKLIVPFAAGGAVDLVARPLAQKLSDVLGQSVIVENRPGAGSIVGVLAAVKAPPDGYTVLLTTGSMVATPLMNANAGYDPIRDLVPVTQVVYSQGTVLATRPNLPSNDVPSLVAAAKKAPNAISYAHTGVGTPPYVAAELFRRHAGIELVPVPYKGTGNVLTDVISGQVDMTFSGIPSVLEFARTGRVKVLASTGTRRASVLPSVPTLQELGYADLDVRGYYGVWLPAGTPQDRIDILYKAAATALQDREIQRVFADGALDIVASPPGAFAAFIARDLDRQRQIVETLGLQTP